MFNKTTIKDGIPYTTLRRGKGREKFVVASHAAPSSGKLLIIYGGHKVPVNGFQKRFQAIGKELSSAGVSAVVHASDPKGSVGDLKQVIAFALKNAKNLTGTDSPQISLAGHSAGAAAAARVAQAFDIQRLLLVAPSQSANLTKFRGEIVTLVGSKDKDCLTHAEATLASAPRASNRQLVVVPGADHVFHTPETNAEYIDLFRAVGGAPPKTLEGRRLARVTLGSGVELAIHPSASDKLLIILGAKDTPIDGWKKRYATLAGKLARSHEAAVIRVLHADDGEAALRQAVAYARHHMKEITGNASSALTLMGHGGGANVAAALAEESRAANLLLISPTKEIDASGFTGRILTVAGEKDLPAVRHASVIRDKAVKASATFGTIVKGADRAFHDTAGNDIFLRSFRWALGLEPPPAALVKKSVATQAPSCPVSPPAPVSISPVPTPPVPSTPRGMPVRTL